MGMNGTITLVSNKDGGCSRKVKIASGMTHSEVFHSELGPEADPDKYTIMVGGKTIEDPKKVTVKDGDFVVIVPKEIKGNDGDFNAFIIRVKRSFWSKKRLVLKITEYGKDI